MRTKLCWICGKPVNQSAVATPQDEAYHLEVALVEVVRPYGSNYRSKPVYICHICARKKVGISKTGTNLNR